MKVGLQLFLILMLFIITGTANTYAQIPSAQDRTIGAKPLERFDIASDTLPSKFDLKPQDISSTVKPCVPLESDSPVCSDSKANLCLSTPTPTVNEISNIQALEAEPLLPIPTLAQVMGLETTQEAQTNPTPTMIPLKDGYAPHDAVLDTSKIFNLVNEYRATRGLSPFEEESSVCELAKVRSSEIIAEIGGSAGYLHSGLYNRNLPYWIFENAKYGSNEEGTVAWWLASPLHHQSIVSDYKHACVKCTGSYCVQLFTSFAPKQTAFIESANQPTPAQ